MGRGSERVRGSGRGQEQEEGDAEEEGLITRLGRHSGQGAEAGGEVQAASGTQRVDVSEAYKALEEWLELTGMWWTNWQRACRGPRQPRPKPTQQAQEGEKDRRQTYVFVQYCTLL